MKAGGGRDFSKAAPHSPVQSNTPRDQAVWCGQILPTGEFESSEFPTILVIWALSGETHKWGKGEREKQIRIHKIKGHGLC